MIQDKIQFFENLNDKPMEEKKRGGFQSKVKELVQGVTEFKRPKAKPFSDDDYLEAIRKNRDTLPIQHEHKTRKQVKRHASNPVKSKAVRLKEKSKSVVEDDVEIEKKLEEWGEKLKQKRTPKNSENGNHDHDDEDSDKNSGDNLHEDKADVAEIFNVSPSSSSEDIFGLNEFEEKSEDNFVVETYNDEGRELIFTFLEIKRKSYRGDDDDLATIMHDTDIIIAETSEILEELTNRSQEELRNGGDSIREENEKMWEFAKSLSKELRDETDSASASNANKDTNAEEESEFMEFYRRTPMRYSTFYEDPPNFNNYFDHNHKQPENVLDVHGNVRIQFNTPSSSVEPSDSEDKKNKITYVIEELLSTEAIYINSLRKVVEDYKPYVDDHLPNNLVGKSAYVFGNIHKIYAQAKKFYRELQKAVGDGKEYEGVAKTFNDFTSMFELYPKYSKNKPTADNYLREFADIIKQKQTSMGDKLDLASYLLAPIQRLGKYVLMFENILKELNKSGQSCEELTRATEMIKGVMRKGNDSIAIDSIKNCDIDLSCQGSFLMREKFMILKPRKFESMVFLFDKIIVFTTSRGVEEFTYHDSIQMVDLNIAVFEQDQLMFHLTNYPKVKRLGNEATYILEAKTHKIKKNWTTAIVDKLWNQLEKAKELLSELHQDEGRRLSKIDIRSNGKKLPNKKRTLPRRSKSTFYAEDP